MILRRLRPAAQVRPIHNHTHFHLAPRLNFTVVQQLAGVLSERVERILRTTAGERITQREEMVQRIFDQRSRREEDGTEPGVERAGSAPRLMPRSGVPAVLLRLSAPAPAVPPAAEPTAAPRIAQSSAPMQPPPLELERISEHVIQTIDRRLQAHRERTGRR